MSGLVLKGIKKSFGETLVLDDISLELPDGELLVLLGASGCGKSTLLRIIAGLEEADSGEIFIQDKRVDKLRPRERNIALVFQNYALYPHMTIEKNIGFPLKTAGMKSAEIKKRVLAVAEMLGLVEKLSNRPGELSGGQRQRVALGRAIIREPSIFLLDEPLSNLDAELRIRMRFEIVELQKKLGRTMIHVTHDQSEALMMADRIALLHKGKLEQIGSPEELYKNPASLFVAGFIGSPRMNLFNVSATEGKLVPFGIPLSEQLLKQIINSLSDNGDSGIKAGLRPEDITLCGDGQYSGVINSCEYLGDQYIAEVNFNKINLTISHLDRIFAPGKEIRFSFSGDALHFFKIKSGNKIRL